MGNPRAGAQGFTLLEVLVSLSILGIALLVIMQIFSAGLRGISASEDYVSATAKAEAKIREALADDKIQEKSWSEITDDGFRLDTSVRETLSERTGNLQVKLLEIDVTVRWGKGMKSRSLTLSTLKTVDRQI